MTTTRVAVVLAAAVLTTAAAARALGTSTTTGGWLTLLGLAGAVVLGAAGVGLVVAGQMMTTNAPDPGTRSVRLRPFLVAGGVCVLGAALTFAVLLLGR